MGIFKAYDIRGVYGKELDEQLAYKIGQAAVKLFNSDILVGYDIRLSSPSLVEAMEKGITDSGFNVIDIGLCSTPMFYFAVAFYRQKGGIMVTASHNPKEYNGFKFCRENAFPVSYEGGINEIERLVNEGNFKLSDEKGQISKKEISDDYKKHVTSFSGKIGKFKVVVDAGNGMGGLIAPNILKSLGLNIVGLYTELDGTFPNHEANPLKEETTKELQELVIKEKADLGIAFDGDADRVGFIDENGKRVGLDIVTALLGENFLTKKKQKVLYDLRSSNIVKEHIESLGGIAVVSRVGHSYIKKIMREQDIVFGGELSGHYYFKNNYFADSGLIAAVVLISLMSKKNKKLSELVAPLNKYFHSGEINSTVKDVDKKLKEIEKEYGDGKILHIDGLSIYYPDWWFNIRPSNTEPLLRLNLEANVKEKMEEKRDELLLKIRS